MKISAPGLIFGLLDNAIEFPDSTAAARARDLTISWTRFKYFGPIIEDATLGGILRQAADTDARYCLIQVYGHILAEVWQPDDGALLPVMEAINEWIEGEDFLVSGHLLEKPGQWYGLKPECLLVNLEHYRRLGCPPVDASVADGEDGIGDLISGTVLDSGNRAVAPTAERVRVAPRLPGWNLVRLSLEAGHTVFDFPPGIDAGMVSLDPHRPDGWMVRETSSADTTEVGETHPMEKQHVFLEGVRELTGKLRNSVFVWNLEPYEDIETPADGFEAPLAALYTVSAGFKPNRILQTHGFEADTRMVVFDYSPPGMEFRRLIHEEWDGIDYPSFLRVLFRKLPSSEAHYLLWDGMTPETLDWETVNRRWQRELDAWGGEEALYQHWQKFRRIKVEYVLCDLLTEQSELLQRIEDEPNALIWWSNAFFSVYSNWLYSTAERRQLYRGWIEKLAQKAPRIWIYGSDCHNVSVNCHTARQYLDWFRRAEARGFDELTPPALNRYQIGF